MLCGALLLDLDDLALHVGQVLGDGRHLLQDLALVGLGLLALDPLTSVLFGELDDLLTQGDGGGLRLGEIGLQQRLCRRIRMAHLEDLCRVPGLENVDAFGAGARTSDDETGGSADSQPDEKKDDQLHVAHDVRPLRQNRERRAASIGSTHGSTQASR